MLPVLLAGPTGCGKSAVALPLATLLRGEIVSADSMQVYRGMDLGTAKPSVSDRARVAHHLLDIADPSLPFDTAQWLGQAEEAVTSMERRGVRAILCGGTGLYFKAWQEGLDAPAPGDPVVRAALEATPLPELLSELQRRDPQTFGRIDRANPRRVVRALEILRCTGRPLPLRDPATVSRRPGHEVVLRRAPEDLRERIERRVDEMFARGWVDEVKGLRGRPGGLERTAAQAIGYRQILEHLQGERDLASTVAWVKTRTWQYARRQGTWFRNQWPGAHVVDVPSTASPEETAAAVADWVMRREAR